MAEELLLHDEPEQVDAQVLVDHYAELIRRAPRTRVDSVPPVNVRAHLRILAIVAGVAVYAATVFIVLRPSINLEALPPRAVLAVEADDLCAQRQAEVLSAIAAYRAVHGTAPERLESLTPKYLAQPATDPASGRPYEYTRDGIGVGLTCPNPERHSN